MSEAHDTIDCGGIRIAAGPGLLTEKIARALRNGRYESGERRALEHVLRPGDRVLDLGAGLGLLATVAALRPEVRVTAVEANPALLPVIRQTLALNGAGDIDLRHGAVTPEAGAPLAFRVAADFWASSLDTSGGAGAVEVPRQVLGALLREVRPTVIVCDIEGAEVGLFDGADLSGVRAAIVELHPARTGKAGAASVCAALASHGLGRSAFLPATSTVALFERPAAEAAATPAGPFARHEVRDWPVPDPRVLMVTCMKNEGPFVLEWLAWHKTVGVTDLVVFTNHCSDGTDALLDRLQDLGHLTHLPNPAMALGSPAFQPVALAYAHDLRQMREADFFISMDVDEFINVRTGDGSLGALFAAAGPFDVLAMTEVNHGSNRQERFAPGWVTEDFPLHQSLRPGPRRARRGVKSIVRLTPRVERLRNHRPDLHADAGAATWLDGSGRPLASLAADRSENGLDCRGTYDLVRLEHFALRSLDSYLAKMHRGDAVVAGKRVSRAYWRTRNRNEESAAGLEDRIALARAWAAAHLEGDAALMDLHRAACTAHAARIEALRAQPEFRERREWILAECW